MSSLCDIKPAKALVDIFELETLVETGSWRGDSIAYALNELHMVDAVSIELSDAYHSQCVNRFEGDRRVMLHKGRSHIVMQAAVMNITSNCLVWLDAHIPDYYECQVEDPMDVYPVPAEIRALKRHLVTFDSSVIICDDLFLIPGDDNPCWGGPGSVEPEARQAKHTSLTEIMSLLQQTHHCEVFTDTPQGFLVASPRA